MFKNIIYIIYYFTIMLISGLLAHELKTSMLQSFCLGVMAGLFANAFVKPIIDSYMDK